MLAFALAACTQPALRVGTSGDYPPFSVSEEGGSVHGFDITVAQAYARDRDVELEIIPFRWPELQQRLLEGRFDVAMSGVTVRGDRLARAPMTSAVARADAIVLVAAGTFGTPTEEEEREAAEAAKAAAEAAAAAAESGEPIEVVEVVEEPALEREELDREDVVVAVNRGAHLEQLARGRFRRARIHAVDDNRSLPALLANRRVHAVVTDSVEARNFRAAHAALYEVLAHDRKAYWVSPEREDLLVDLNRWIGGRAASRWLETERNVWMDDPQRPMLPPDEATLIDHIGQRLMLMPIVAEVKRARGLPVDAAGREDEIAYSARAAALSIGLDPVSYMTLMRAEIDAAKAVQRAVLAQPPAILPEELPDLDDDLRPAIDRIDGTIRTMLLWALPVRSSVDEIVEALRADAPVPGLDDGSLRAIAWALRAMPAPRRLPGS